MNLVIDIGNTKTKMALIANDDHIIEQKRVDGFSMETLSSFLSENSHQVTHAIISSVSKKISREVTAVFDDQDIQPLILSFQTPVPLQIHYDTPQTLGTDRIAAAVGGKLLFPEQAVLVIDAGTCITYDYVDEKNNYEGGAISPGISLRYKSIHEHTENLPLLQPEAPLQFPGKSTTASIHAGVLLAVRLETDGMIERFKENNPHIQTIITGGDAKYFDGKLKNNIFARSNVILLGLNKILNYNLEENDN
jgi:type III pantothenate kinase